MVKSIAGSKVLLLGSGFGMCLLSSCWNNLRVQLPRNTSFPLKKVYRQTLTLFFLIVTKPTVEVLSKADVEVTVGMCHWL
jgi:hypothetical protein